MHETGSVSSLHCRVNELRREVIGGDISADSKGITARELDFVDDELRLLLLETARLQESRESGQSGNAG